MNAPLRKFKCHQKAVFLWYTCIMSHVYYCNGFPLQKTVSGCINLNPLKYLLNLHIRRSLANKQKCQLFVHALNSLTQHDSSLDTFQASWKFPNLLRSIIFSCSILHFNRTSLASNWEFAWNKTRLAILCDTVSTPGTAKAMISPFQWLRVQIPVCKPVETHFYKPLSLNFSSPSAWI